MFQWTIDADPALKSFKDAVLDRQEYYTMHRKVSQLAIHAARMPEAPIMRAAAPPRRSSRWLNSLRRW